MIRADVIQECLARIPRPVRFAVETGTLEGRSTRRLAEAFERVFTIEVDPALHARSRQAFSCEGLGNIECLLGDSGCAIEEAISRIPRGEPALFFLDAHWSGDASVDWAASRWHGYRLETGHRGAPGRAPSSRDQCPLEEELSAIARLATGECLVLVDDLQNLPADGPGLRGSSFLGEDWSHLSRARLLELARPRLLEAIELKRSRQLLLHLRELPALASNRHRTGLFRPGSAQDS